MCKLTSYDTDRVSELQKFQARIARAQKEINGALSARKHGRKRTVERKLDEAIFQLESIQVDLGFCL